MLEISSLLKTSTNNHADQRLNSNFLITNKRKVRFHVSCIQTTGLNTCFLIVQSDETNI